MINFIKSLFECKHKNKRTEKWLDVNNTPMMMVKCIDCNKKLDYGHVYADADTWLNENDEND